MCYYRKTNVSHLLKKRNKKRYDDKQNTKHKLKDMTWRPSKLLLGKETNHYKNTEYVEGCQSCGLLLMADYEYFR